MRTRSPAALLLLLLACGQPKTPPPTPLTLAQLQDPTQCQGCHPTQFADWSSSMHAYASADPVFLAMNQRGQRETDGGLGTFCLQCHQPMVVVGGLAPDAGRAVDGVTCYFCHSAAQVAGAHDDPLRLDGGLYGEIANPIAGIPHGAVYSSLFDASKVQSAAMCGSCHDIVNGHGAYIERTFGEWLDSGFSVPPEGESCSQCHMQVEFGGTVANVTGAPTRPLFRHAFPAVDSALIDFAGQDEDAGLRAQIQTLLQFELQDAVCVEQAENGVQIQVITDNVSAGHYFPSGAAQDRRMWFEVVATDADGGVLYRSGVVDAGADPTQNADPDFWMLRDCMFDAAGGQVGMFWQAYATEGNEMPVLSTFDSALPGFYQAHLMQTYPRTGLLGEMPAQVTATAYLLPMGPDVLNDLVASGDLDASFVQAIPRLQVGETVVWTADAVNTSYSSSSNPTVHAPLYPSVPCVGNGINVASFVLAPAHTHCFP